MLLHSGFCFVSLFCLCLVLLCFVVEGTAGGGEGGSAQSLPHSQVTEHTTIYIEGWSENGCPQVAVEWKLMRAKSLLLLKVQDGRVSVCFSQWRF